MGTNDFEPIVIPVIIDDSAIPVQMNKVGRAVEESSGKASIGAKGAGIAFKGLIHEVGLTGAAARLFGHEVTDLTMALGAGATGLGLVILAGTAAYKIYDTLANSAAKLREEQIKNAEAAMTWIEAARVSTVETKALKDANDELWEVAKKQSQLNLETGIKTETQVIIKNYEEVERLRDEFARYDPLQWLSKEKIKEKLTTAEITYEESIGKIHKMYANLETAQGKGALRRKPDLLEETNPFWQQDQQKAWLASMQTDYITARGYQIDYDKARLEQAKASRASAAEIYTMEMTVFDQTTGKMILASKNRDEADAIYTRRKIERATLTMNHERQMDLMMLQSKTKLAGEASQVMEQFYEASGKRQRWAWYAARGMAAGEAYFQYQLAAANAVGQEGPLGIGMSAYFDALSYIKPALILATSLSGPGGGGGAMPTYSANPVTSLPTSTGGAGGSNITININGQKVGEYQRTAGGVLKAIYENNGSMDGYSISVERHA